MNSAFKTTLLFLASALVGAATCDRPPAAAETATVKRAVTTADVCAGQPDGAMPPGCDRVSQCSFDQCKDQVCTFTPTPGVPCGGGGATCNEEGACVPPDGPDPECTGNCESNRLSCERGCGSDTFCQCSCAISYQHCVWACGGPPPDPEICPA
jgi:hypothetical protein